MGVSNDRRGRPDAAPPLEGTSAGEMAGRLMPGFAIARPDAANADASPVAAVPFRGGDLLEPTLTVGPMVAERGWFELALELRRQGRRFLLVALPMELIDTASELSGTSNVEPIEGVVTLGDMVRLMEG